MSDIKQELFEAISIIVHSENEKLKFTKTIEAIIYDNSEAAIGRYRVKYQDSIFYVYSNDVSLKYNVNDTVLVLVPEGDFSQQKIIVGKKGSAANEETLASTQDILQKIDLIGPDWSSDNLAGYHDKISDSIGLIAGGTVESFIIFNGFESQESSQAKLFNNYLQKCHSFLIKADFRTDFPSDKIQDYYGGNYGVKVHFIQNDEEYVYTLDLSNMTGDPYNYSVNSPQYIVFKYDNEALQNATLSKIEIFQEGFNVIPQEFEDIFISNLQISFVEEIDTLDSGYSINVLTPQGNMINNNDITLIPQLKLNGVAVDYSSAMWFMRDISVNVGSSDYNSYAGLGWKQITGNENINKNILILNSSNIGSKIYSNTELKVVIVENKNTFSKIVEVFPLISLYNFTMEASFNDKVVSLTIEPEDKLESNYSYSWGKVDESGISYSLNTTGRTHIFNINEVYLNNTFYCSIYNGNGELLSTVKRVITKETTSEDFSVIFTGNHFYCYDANGDIDINVANSEHQLGFEIYDPNGEKVEILSSEWIFPDENLSMISPITEDLTLSVINYKIQSKYNVNRLNNTVILKVETYNNQSFEFRKEIVCLKTGNSGTNGTKYVAALTFDSNNHSYVKKGDQISQTAIVNLNVYEDGVPVSSADYSYSWSILGKDKDIKLIEFVGSPTATQAILCYNSSQNNITNENALLASSIVEVVIKIGGYKIEALKAIPVVLSGDYDNTIDWIDFVEYNPAGEEPVYNKNASIPKDWSINSFNTTETDDNPIYFKSNRIRVFESPTVYTNKNFSEFNYELDYSLIPVDKYNNSGKSGNVIFNKNGISLLWPVIFWINTYGNESINGWDGVSTVINEKDGYILSPVVGAGEKDDSTNLFTGVLMGTVGYYSGNSIKKSTGLFGFDKGVQTFNIDSETGNVTLGSLNGGQILINSDDSIIKSGNYDNSKVDTYYSRAGTEIDLLHGSITSMNFAIDDSGNAYFRGNITANSGKIGAWSIINGDLQAEVGTGSIWLSASEGSIYGLKKDAEGHSWSITPDGITTSYLNASGGNIGGWTIAEDSLQGGYTTLNSDGSCFLGDFSIEQTYDEGGNLHTYFYSLGDVNTAQVGLSNNSGLTIWSGWDSSNKSGLFGANTSGEIWSVRLDGRGNKHNSLFETGPDYVVAGDYCFYGSGDSGTHGKITKWNGSSWVESSFGSLAGGANAGYNTTSEPTVNTTDNGAWYPLYISKNTVKQAGMYFKEGIYTGYNGDSDVTDTLKSILGGGNGNVTYAVGEGWSYTDEDKKKQLMASSPVFDDGNWKGLYITSTGTGDNFTIDTIRTMNMQFKYGLCVSDSADGTISDENFKAAFKSWLGETSSSQSVSCSGSLTGQKTWTFYDILNENSPQTVSGQTDSKDWVLPFYSNGLAFATVRFTNGLLTKDGEVANNTNYIKGFASSIAGYL